ncbi:MAG: hypothetical protein U0166_05375 [Acidobacteriota bacterium]
MFFSIFLFEVIVRTAAAIQKRGSRGARRSCSRWTSSRRSPSSRDAGAGSPPPAAPAARGAPRLLAPFASDLVALTARPERRRQLAFVLASVAALCAISAIPITNLGVGLDADSDGVVEPGEQGFADALWWSFRQIESPDNIVKEPRATLIFALSLILNVSGFFVFSFIGISATLVADLVEVSRLQRVGFHNHVVVLNPRPTAASSSRRSSATTASSSAGPG